MRQVVTARVIAVLLGLLALNAGAQAIQAVGGWLEKPTLLIVLQSACAAAAGTAAVGVWRLRPWAPYVTVLYGVIAAGLIVSLGPILDLEPAARNGLLGGALGALCVTLALAWGARWSQIRKY